MKLFSFVCLSAIFSAAFSFHLEDFELNSEKQWLSFKQTYGRRFVNQEDENDRKEIFKMNVKNILIHNLKYARGLETFAKGINQFSDMTMEEFRASMLTLRVPENHQRNGSTFLTPLSLSDLPKEVDWRKKGFVTPVKDQGDCGSCWAFSATGSIEGQQARKTGSLISLSEQNLVDCSIEFGNLGCSGGLVDPSFEYVLKNGGIDTEESYPYVAVDQECAFKKESIGATITGYVDIEKGNEKKLLEAVATVGPVSAGIDAGHESFVTYKSGIYFEPECRPKSLNHGILIVGYGTENEKDYWLIKNSWGTKWGEKGYMKMERNGKNHCGIATFASYPTV